MAAKPPKKGLVPGRRVRGGVLGGLGPPAGTPARRGPAPGGGRPFQPRAVGG